MKPIDELIDEILAGEKVFLDTETCGFHGIAVLIQWAVDNGEIHMYEVFKRPFEDTLRLLDAIAQRDLIGFNLSFDAFHLCKLYCLWHQCLNVMHPDTDYDQFKDELPENHIHFIETCEEAAKDGPCWKPRSACDLMLHGRKNEFQTLMRRSDIRIRRVPTPLAYVLAEQLEARIEIPDIYFARFKKDSTQWRVYDIEDEEHFKDVVLKFNASAGLKYLAEFALGLEPEFHFEDIALDSKYNPKELGYAPTARAAREKFAEECKGEENVLSWDRQVVHHIDHWAHNENARAYAEFDIVCTRELYKFFREPECGDDDSVLACMVAAVRWHGFAIDLEGIRELLAAAQRVVDESPVNINKPTDIREYFGEVMDATEMIMLAESTRKQIIQEIATWTAEDDNPEAAARATKILEVKIAAKEVELYKKLLLARRLHADLNVIGTMSSRMSGGGGLNVQGIKHAKFVRKQFPLSWDGMTLCGGDFDSYEVTLADAVYDDDELRQILLSGKKLHGIFGTAMYPGHTYDEILASDGHATNDMYTKAKAGVFSLIYFGTPYTLMINQGLDNDTAEEAYQFWQDLVPGIGENTQRITGMFMGLEQNEQTRAITWRDPEEFVETKDGFRRYFTLENMVAKELFGLAQKPPKEWKDCKIKVARRDRLQTASGAVQSALYGAAFAIQSANVRAAGNHEIQSLGATICKRVQRKVWDLQPHGVHEFVVAPLNVHDEIMCPTKPDYVNRVAEVIEDSVEAERTKVPLIGMTWVKQMENWAEKNESEGNVIPIGPMKNPNHPFLLEMKQNAT